MTRRLGPLILGTVAFWAVAAYPALRLWGPPGLVYSAVAVLICLVPMAVTLLWGRWAMRQTGEQQLLMLFGGTGLRMFTALGAGLALHFALPYFQQTGFWVCLLATYLFTLALEMVLLVGAWAEGDREST